jgi:hypothetical protein
MNIFAPTRTVETPLEVMADRSVGENQEPNLKGNNFAVEGS